MPVTIPGSSPGTGMTGGVALRRGGRVLMRLCDVGAAWRRRGCPVIILVLDAEAAEAGNCFHALLPRIKVA